MFLLQMAGFPGSGKSTISKMIAQDMNVIVIDRDVIKTSMINSKVPNEIVNNASYSVVFDLAKFYLGIDISVIIDTPCYYEETLNHGIEIANIYGAKYKYIECKVDDYSIIEDRIRNRNRLISQIEYTTKERFNNASDKSKRPNNGNYLIINTNLEHDYNMKLIRKYLEEGTTKNGKVKALVTSDDSII